LLSKDLPGDTHSLFNPAFSQASTILRMPHLHLPMQFPFGIPPFYDLIVVDGSVMSFPDGSVSLAGKAAGRCRLMIKASAR
jgi:hypothetical protein